MIEKIIHPEKYYGERLQQLHEAHAAVDKSHWPETESAVRAFHVNTQRAARENLVGEPVVEESPVIVYHSTSFELAQRFLQEGIIQGEKSRELPAFLKEKGHTHGPGYGLASETYVAAEPFGTRFYGGSGYDRVVLAVLTTIGDTKPSPEAIRSHMTTSFLALAMGHSLLKHSVNAKDLFLIGLGSFQLLDAIDVISGKQKAFCSKRY